MSDQEPTVAVRRQILEQKRDEFRARGYQYAISAKVAERINDPTQAEQAHRLSRQSYEGARVCEEEIAALMPHA